jgi:hypothetical protein
MKSPKKREVMEENVGSSRSIYLQGAKLSDLSELLRTSILRVSL